MHHGCLTSILLTSGDRCFSIETYYLGSRERRRINRAGERKELAKNIPQILVFGETSGSVSGSAFREQFLFSMKEKAPKCRTW